MADKIFHSTAVTFVDMTDSRILDVYIASNHPTVQLCNANKTPLEYTPDWSVTNLKLEASFYLDSTSITPEKIEWYTKIGTTETLVGSNATLSITTNVLANNPIITYKCKATYENLTAFKEVTFMRVDAGVNGASGSPAPSVQAQYSVDGQTGWTSTLNTSMHKYIRYSYDGGKTYTDAIKMVGEDGTSVRILGTASSVTQVAGTSYYTIVYSSSSITSAVLGDAYLYNGDLYVCADARDGQDYFINVGKIQGPTGSAGQSSYLFIRYATDANGTGMSTSPSGKTYIGVATSTTNVVPTTASSYTWSKFVGDSAKSIILSGDSQVFKVSASGAYTPSTINVTAQAFNTSATTWTYSTNGGQTFVSTAPTGVSRNGNVVTITGSTLSTNSIVVRASDGSVEDVFTVYKAFDGVNGNPGAPGAPASMAFLTNENVTFSANASGQITATSIATNVVAYNGTTKTVPTIGAISNLPDGMTATVGTSVNNEVPIVFTISNSATLGSASSNNGSVTIPVTSPVSTNLILSWSKVNAGSQGPQGNKGNDSYTVLLTNESHVFAGDVSNAIDGSTTTQVLAYNGSAAQSVTISSVNGKTASTTDTDTGIAGLKFKCSALSGTSPTITFTCTTAFVSASGTIPIVLSVGGISFTKMFTYSIAFKGDTGGIGAQGIQGVPATSYWLVSSASAVQKTSTGTITVTPSTITFTGKSKTGTNAPVDYACRWVIDSSTDGTTYANLYTSTANEAVKSITVATTYKTIRARMYMAGGTTSLLDEQIIPVVTDGVSASLVKITPSTYYFKSTTGKDGTFTPDYIYLYPRFQTVTYSKWEYSTNGGTSWTTVTSGSNGLTIGTYNSVANSLQIAKTSALYTDSVTSISFRCVSSTSSVYDTVSIAKIYDVVDLQIGGRNLVVGTNRGNQGWAWTMQTGDYTTETVEENGVSCCKLTRGNVLQTGWSVIYFNNIGREKLEAGQEYTISLDIKPSINTSAIIDLRETNSANQLIASRIKEQRTISANVWNQIYSTVRLVDPLPDSAAQVFYMQVNGDINVSYLLKNLKIEKGNKVTDWSPAPEDLNRTTFQIYAPNGYLLTNEIQSLTLQTFAYEGSIEIKSDVAFQWSHLIDEVWTDISGANGTTLNVTKSDVLKAKSYRCVMTYKGQPYIDTITVQDKTDTYSSMLCVSSNATNNECYWVLHSLVYSDKEEIDPLLGPVLVNAPDSPVNGDYWYAVDPTNATVTLKKYNGTSWVNSTDKQSLTYAWNIIDDGSVKRPLGATSKVKIVSCSDFTGTATLVCEVSNTEDGLLTQSSLSLTDASDPIVSTEEPTATVDGQIWIKPNGSGTFLMFVWDKALNSWIMSDMDTRNKVYTSRPSSYNVGDLWITASDTDHGSYLHGTLLQAQKSNTSYNASDWSPTLRYDQDIDDMKETLNNLAQYVTITSAGLRIGARSATGELSPFTSLFTSTELSFYQNAEKLLTLANNQLTAPRIVVEDDLEVQGSIRLGELKMIIESNGSFSFAILK